MTALPHISRAHVYRIGAGGAHLHIWFFARPEGQAQLYGSSRTRWSPPTGESPDRQRTARLASRQNWPGLDLVPGSALRRLQPRQA